MLAQGYLKEDMKPVTGKNKSAVSLKINCNKDERNGEYRIELA
jgi:uncharacterized membrane protein